MKHITIQQSNMNDVVVLDVMTSILTPKAKNCG